MLIGLAGCKGSGKDTVGQYLVDSYGFTKIAFADKLKEAVANLFNITLDHVDGWKDNRGGALDYVEVHLDISGGAEYVMGWREFLQRFGTEMGRNTFGEDFWVEQWHMTYYKLQQYKRHDPDPHVVVTDVRFINEAKHLIREGGRIVEIVRPGHEPDGHASEEPLPRNLMLPQISNNGNIDDLCREVDRLMEVLRAR